MLAGGCGRYATSSNVRTALLAETPGTQHCGLAATAGEVTKGAEGKVAEPDRRTKKAIRWDIGQDRPVNTLERRLS